MKRAAAVKNNKSSNGFYNGEIALREEDSSCKNLKEKKSKSCKKLSNEVVTENRWQDLHPPILELILKGLSLTDRIRFRLVCHSWNAIEKQCLYPPACQFPWLLLHGLGRIQRGITFYSLSESQMYHINLPLLSGKWILASCKGWLLISYEHEEVERHFLINPVSKELIQIPNIETGCWDFLSIPETTDQEKTIVLFSQCHRLLVFRRGNDNRWMKQSYQNGIACPFISCKGKLYGLHFMYKILAIDLTDGPKEWLLDMDCSKVPPLTDNISVNLVESCGEVLLVSTNKVPDNYSFQVFKANFDVMTWVKVESLGDQILFLSDRGSISLSASELRREGNKIYYLPSEASDESQNEYLIEFNLESQIPIKFSVPGYQGPISFWM